MTGETGKNVESNTIQRQIIADLQNAIAQCKTPTGYGWRFSLKIKDIFWWQSLTRKTPENGHVATIV